MHQILSGLEEGHHVELTILARTVESHFAAEEQHSEDIAHTGCGADDVGIDDLGIKLLEQCSNHAHRLDGFSRLTAVDGQACLRQGAWAGNLSSEERDLLCFAEGSVVSNDPSGMKNLGECRQVAATMLANIEARGVEPKDGYAGDHITEQTISNQVTTVGTEAAIHKLQVGEEIATAVVDMRWRHGDRVSPPARLIAEGIAQTLLKAHAHQ